MADVVEINRRMIDTFGGVFFLGDDNLANPGSLEHVPDEVQVLVFGYDPYPSLAEKAAAIAWRITTGHVFHDGNKRTGIEACRLFLELNGYAMRIDREVVDMAIAVAVHNVQFVDFVTWVEKRAISKRG